MFIALKNLADGGWREGGRREKNWEERKEVVDTSLMSDRYHDENAVSNRFVAVDSSWLLLLDCQFRGVFHGILSSFLPFLFFWFFPIRNPADSRKRERTDKNSSSNLEVPLISKRRDVTHGGAYVYNSVRRIIRLYRRRGHAPFTVVPLFYPDFFSPARSFFALFPASTPFLFRAITLIFASATQQTRSNYSQLNLTRSLNRHWFCIQVL